MLVLLGRGRARPLSCQGLSLQTLVRSAVFDLDATRRESYGGGGQLWQNLVALPADGSAQSANHAFLGVDNTVSTDDPAFAGGAGLPSARFEFDGGDRMQMTGASARWHQNLSSTQPFSMACVFKTGASIGGGTNVNCFIQNGANTATARGITLRYTSTDLVVATCNGTVITSHNIPLVLSANTNYALIFTLNPTNGACKIYLNSRTPAATGTATIAGGLGASTSLGLYRGMVAGVRVYAHAMFNTVLTDAQAAAVISTYNTRHGRTYA